MAQHWQVILVRVANTTTDMCLKIIVDSNIIYLWMFYAFCILLWESRPSSDILGVDTTKHSSTYTSDERKAVYYDTTVHHSINTLRASYGTMISVPTVQCVPWL